MVFKIINFLCLVFYDGYTQILYNHTNNKVIKYIAINYVSTMIMNLHTDKI